jgi:predicted transcriptional regulator
MAGDANGTSGGVELDAERLRDLADQAERGYEPQRLRSRPRRGRPPMGRKAASVFQVRLEPELRAALERSADVMEATPSEVVRAALRVYLELPSGAEPVTAASEARERFDASADERRAVTPNPSGGWDVRRPTGQRASSHHATQKEAIQVARRILKNRGGGELLIEGRDGLVRDRVTVSRDVDPRERTG